MLQVTAKRLGSQLVKNIILENIFHFDITSATLPLTNVTQLHVHSNPPPSTLKWGGEVRL